MEESLLRDGFTVLFFIGVGLFGLWTIGVIFYFLLDERYHLIIKLPKNKKFSTKVDPIYKLNYRDSIYCESYFNIQKWSLKWNEINCIIKFIFIYPTSIHRWGYSEDVDVFIGDKIKVDELFIYLNENNITLKDYYENKIAEIQKEIDLENMKDNTFNSKINNLNKEFNENYE